MDEHVNGNAEKCAGEGREHGPGGDRIVRFRAAAMLGAILVGLCACLMPFSLATAKVATAYAADFPNGGDITAGVIARSTPTSAELSDDGVDYNWLYRRGDYWYRMVQYPETEPLEYCLAFIKVGDKYYSGEDYFLGNTTTGNNSSHGYLYNDGLLVYQVGIHYRFDNVVAHGYAFNPDIKWQDRVALNIYPEWGMNFRKENPFGRASRLTYESSIAKVERVELDETLEAVWGPREDLDFWSTRPDNTDCLVYLDNWFNGCLNLKSIKGFEHVYLGNVVNMSAMFKGCSQLEEVDLSSADTHNCKNFAGMFEGCESLITLKFGAGWTQAGVDSADASDGVARGKAVFPHDMIANRDGKTVRYREGEVIPDGAGVYTVADRTSLSSATMLFKDPADPSKAPTGSLTCEYTGSQIKPGVTVTKGGKRLTQGRDFTVAYINNVEDGTARVEVTGVGAYFGRISKEFTIEDTGAYVFLYENGTLVMKAKHQAPGAGVMSSSAQCVMSARWFDSKTPDPGASVPWRSRAASIKKVIVDKSFSGFQPKTAEGWFAGCAALTDLQGLENLDVSLARSAKGLFKGCKSLRSASLDPLRLSSAVNVSSMFEGCAALSNVALPELGMPKATDANFFFKDCTALRGFSLSYALMPLVKNLNGFFQGCTSLEMISLANISFPKARNVRAFLDGCTGLKMAYLDGMHLPAATDASGFLRGCTSLKIVSARGVRLPSATSLAGFFAGCKELTSVEASGFTLAEATDLSSFFSGCASLVNLDIAGLSAPKATDVSGFLEGCGSLETLALGGLASRGRANMSKLLADCPGLKTLTTSPAWCNAGKSKWKLRFATRTFRMSPTCKRYDASTAVPNGAGEYRLRELAMQFTRIVMEKPDYTCTGKALKPKVKVMLGDVQLQQGTDYTLKYANNVYPGKASITVTGRGTMSGGLVVPFNVVARVTKVGDRLVYETEKVKYTFKVTKVTNNGKTTRAVNAELVDVRVKNGTLSTMAIPETCTVGGVKVTITAVTAKLTGQFRNVKTVSISARVVKIGARAFAKAKSVRKLLVKSARLKSVKNCLKDSKVSNVETRVMLSSSRKSTYKKWFTKQSGKTGVKFTYGLNFA